jgi:hypothetical protein
VRLEISILALMQPLVKQPVVAQKRRETRA